MNSNYRFSKTKKLDLSGCTSVGDAPLLALAQKTPLLEEINLDQCDKISLAALTTLMELCPNLNSFDLTNARLLSKNAAAQLVAATKKDQLRRFVINGKLTTSSALKAVTQHCPLLEVLDLSGTSLGRLGIEELQRQCPKLREINIATCVIDCPKSRIEPKNRGFPHLEILSVAGVSFATNGDHWERLLCNSPQLSVLDVRSTTFFSTSGLHDLPVMPKLRVFLMSACQGVTQQLLGSFFFCFVFCVLCLS